MRSGELRVGLAPGVALIVVGGTAAAQERSPGETLRAQSTAYEPLIAPTPERLCVLTI